MRANLNGTDIERRFIEGNAQLARGVAVGARRIYWTNPDRIGRARIDGTNPQRSLVVGLHDPQGIAVDSQHLYWVDAGAIARANLDGTGVEPGFIPAAGLPRAIAVDADHVYWTNGDAIARANLDGTGVDLQFIAGSIDPIGLAVDAAHIYWASDAFVGVLGHGFIGRANLDGSGITRQLIAIEPGSEGLALGGTRLLWTNPQVGAIGAAELDGSWSDLRLIEQGFLPGGIAADALRPPGKVRSGREQAQPLPRIRIGFAVEAARDLTGTARGKVRVQRGRGQNNPTYRLRTRLLEVKAGRERTYRVRPRRNASARRITRALERGEGATANITVHIRAQDRASKTKAFVVRLTAG